jgi:hypothetical protein
MTLKSSAPLPDNNEKLPLREIFNREAAQAVKDFPQLDGRFIFIDAPNNIAITRHLDLGALGLQSDRQLSRVLGKIKNEAEKAGSSMATKLGDNEIDLMVYTPLPFKLFTGKDQPGEMEIMATFDHELGHLVVKGGFFSRDSTLRESAADVFAVLRHIQRYGEASEAIDRGGWRRAFDFVMSGDAGHFTTLAVDEVTALKDRLDIKVMTPQQTADLSARIALQFTPHMDVTNEAADSFEPVRRVMHYSRDLTAGLEKLAEITLSDAASYHTFKIGARALERFLDGKISTPDGPLLLQGRFWDDVRRELTDRMARLDKEGLLMGMPLKGARNENDNAPPKAFTPKPPSPPPAAGGWKSWFRPAA